MRHKLSNHHRGEVEGILDDKPYNLCLTLGALAELESVFGDENMMALAQRFEGGKLSARDCVRIIGAGLRGAGYDLDDATVARMQTPNGIPGFIDIVARLLIATFSPSPRPLRGEGRGEGRQQNEGEGRQQTAREGLHKPNNPQALEVPAPVPFPGTR